MTALEAYGGLWTNEHYSTFSYTHTHSSIRAHAKALLSQVQAIDQYRILHLKACPNTQNLAGKKTDI